jgi:hypothetical protein
MSDWAAVIAARRSLMFSPLLQTHAPSKKTDTMPRTISVRITLD